MSVSLALFAMILEAGIGFPDKVYKAIGHPVTWIGGLIAWMDRSWNGGSASRGKGRAVGIAALLLLVGVSGLAGLLIQAFAGSLIAFLAVALAASTLIAQRSLHRHVAAVADAVEQQGVAGGRHAVSQIVGRDPEKLDEAGICRAAIESLSENFSDGVVAPVFWLAVAGVPGAAIYKSVNTADSMIGHRTERHRDFGWASARFDDLINLPASRLSALLIVCACLFISGASARNSWTAVRRDAGRHRSPNAGWPEAAMAGGLGLSLAGPRYYGGELVDDVEMGHGGRRDADARDIRNALRVYKLADALLIALLLILAITLRG